MTNSRPRFGRYWLSVIGCWLFAVVLSACGGGDNAANTAPKAATLEGNRNNTQTTFEPAVDVKEAPTKAHSALAKLLPKSALVKNSVAYCGWDSKANKTTDGAPANAPMPAVTAKYHSTGFKLVTDPSSKTGSAEQQYPQTCTLILIKAPEAAAAEPLASGITTFLESKGFKKLDDMQLVLGFKKTQAITRYALVVPKDDVDDVYVAYVKVLGDVVVYALESEAAPKPPAGKQQLATLNASGRGTRVGAELITLVLARSLAS